MQRYILVMGGPFQKGLIMSLCSQCREILIPALAFLAMFRLSRAAKLVKKLHAAEQTLSFWFHVAAVCHPHPASFPWGHHFSLESPLERNSFLLQMHHTNS